ncbi:hypothetical protein JKP88DRAFT_275203 [Tribonema minus]|uniref:Uncharacterized protein n=1 Tax=Tribonema minus TaxID=303371 RepID=A0A835ZDI0_9STRA|nr:hypothetical protein JKP88DRAFT_275203 [Tribonema minus]
MALAAAAAADLAHSHSTPGVTFKAHESTVRAVVDADVTLTAADVHRLLSALQACVLKHGVHLGVAALAAAVAEDLARDHAAPGVAFEARESTVRAAFDADVTLAAEDIDRLLSAFSACISKWRAAKLQDLKRGVNLGAAALAAAAAADLAHSHSTPGVTFKAHESTVRAVFDADVTLTAAHAPPAQRTPSARESTVRAAFDADVTLTAEDIYRLLSALQACVLKHGVHLGTSALAAAVAADLARKHATPGVTFKAHESTVRAVFNANVTLTAADVDRLHSAFSACISKRRATAGRKPKPPVAQRHSQLSQHWQLPPQDGPQQMKFPKPPVAQRHAQLSQHRQLPPQDGPQQMKFPMVNAAGMPAAIILPERKGDLVQRLKAHRREQMGPVPYHQTMAGGKT